MLSKCLMIVIAVALCVTWAQTDTQEQDRLDIIRNRGYLLCGVKSVPDAVFARAENTTTNETGSYNYTGGFDVDLCRAVATAIFGDPDAVQFVGVSLGDRFKAVRNGSIDILSRTTTNTLTRRTTEQIYFAPTTFYSGQGFAVHPDSGLNSLKDIDVAGNTVCVLGGSTSVANTPYLVKHAKIVVIDYEPDFWASFADGNCTAITNDKSTLAAKLVTPDGGFSGKILEPTYSKEPLAMGTHDLPSYLSLRQTMDAVANGLFNAEEAGINSRNVLVQSTNTSLPPRVQRLLGFNVDRTPFTTGLPVQSSFMVDVIGKVGNYAEIYQRNVEFAIPRNNTQNELYTKNGLIYGTPFD